ncbi:MAG: ATP-binding cassette domain-containing protein [Candidatus Acidulodesulfobacterium ferriphilum]|uniref:ATP-binding cassette domain-containing protein n=1 Tax=Candidatus Acidulodesulfobacterium ferriphilum TaxID=2597223 RepID=A0A519BCQ4_9DELT|nr:MAG: ATP-binding cassette domain-containing protein [Candidatus Acidulodesulfobacterium ferriphilum]
MRKDFNILKRLVPYILPYKKRLILAMISMAIVSVLTGLLAYVVKPLINNIFITKSYEDLLLIPILVMAIFVVKNIFYYAEFYYIGNVGQNIIRTLRDEVYSAIVKFPVPKLNKIPTGVLIARITYDINIIQRTVSDSVSAVMKDILTILVLIVVVFYMDFYLAVVVFVLFPVVIIPVTLLGKKARKTSTDTQTEMGNITKFLDETISSLRTVKAYNMEELEISRFKKLSDNLYRFLMRMTKIRGLTVPFVELIGGVSVSLIIFVGGLQVIKFGYTPGNFFSFLTAILLLYEPVKSLSRLNNSLQEGIAAGTRIFEIIDGESEKMGAHQRSLPEEISSLEIRNLYFSYDKSKGYDLKNINIKALKGKTIAIVGYSGAGKSTISMLIPRFYDPDSGEILVNGINIREFNLKDLRNSISYVSQQVILFNESIRFNIAYGSFSKDMKDIIKASEFAFAHDFIMKLPNGYDTIVDEAGLRLSGGEKQRILIARAFLKNAPIIVLDEATSSLDSESEKEIQGALFGTDENPYGLCQNKIAIIIAHRLSTVKRADTIYVLDNGEIVESGNHEELIEVNGIYKNLLIKQMGN